MIIANHLSLFFFFLTPSSLSQKLGLCKMFKLSGPIREGLDCFPCDVIGGLTAAPGLPIESLVLLAELTVGGRVVGGVHLLRAILRYLLHSWILRHVGSLNTGVSSNVRSGVSQ